MGTTTYLCVDEVAKKFGINTTTVYRLAQQGKLPGFKIGGQWRFQDDMLDRWVQDKVTIKWLKSQDERGD